MSEFVYGFSAVLFIGHPWVMMMNLVRERSAPGLYASSPRLYSHRIHQENCIYIIEEKTGELYCIILN